MSIVLDVPWYLPFGGHNFFFFFVLLIFIYIYLRPEIVRAAAITTISLNEGLAIFTLCCAQLEQFRLHIRHTPTHPEDVQDNRHLRTLPG